MILIIQIFILFDIYFIEQLFFEFFPNYPNAFKT